MIEDKLAAKLADANTRLKSAKCRLRIKLRGNKLTLQGTLPPKPASTKQEPHQQEIYTTANYTVAGIDFCFKLAQKASVEIESKVFDWSNYTNSKPPIDTTSANAIIEQFKVVKLQEIAERTWYNDYLQVYELLDPAREITVDAIAKLIKSTQQNTRQRRRYYLALRQLAKFAKVELPENFDDLIGNYSATRVKPRDIPSDEQIIEVYRSIINPAWQCAYGILATYGLRPSELGYLELDTMPVLKVHGTKNQSSDRRVWAIYPEWYELFNLSNITLPPVAEFGKQANHQFVRYQIPFPPYALRHAWAIRSMIFGLPIELAARQMGHSQQVHSQTYHAWISDREHQAAYDLLAKARQAKPTTL